MSGGQRRVLTLGNSSGSKGGRVLVLVAGLLGLGALSEPAERRADASVRFVLAHYDQFDETDAGLGADVSYRLADWIAADAQLSFFPDELGEPVAFSGSRLEGLIGLRVGHRFGNAGLYGALRPGVVKFSEAPAPRPCILIFPPPLECSLAGGKSLLALNYGAGFELHPGDRAVIRAEVGDLMIRYSGPAFDKDREIFADHLWSHNLRATASFGIRF